MNWFRRFMMGRYGVDQLSFAMLLLSMVLVMFTRGRLWFLAVLGFVLLGLAYYRMLSRNISARAGKTGSSSSTGRVCKTNGVAGWPG